MPLKQGDEDTLQLGILFDDDTSAAEATTVVESTVADTTTVADLTITESSITLAAAAKTPPLAPMAKVPEKKGRGDLAGAPKKAKGAVSAGRTARGSALSNKR